MTHNVQMPIASSFCNPGSALASRADGSFETDVKSTGRRSKMRTSRNLEQRIRERQSWCQALTLLPAS